MIDCSGRIANRTLNSSGYFSQCRTAAQDLAGDLQKFQADRAKVTVPDALSNSDLMLGNALSAAMAADQELISGMDTGNRVKIRDGYYRLVAAMLSIAKAEAALGIALQ